MTPRARAGLGEQFKSELGPVRRDAGQVADSVASRAIITSSGTDLRPSHRLHAGSSPQTTVRDRTKKHRGNPSRYGPRGKRGSIVQPFHEPGPIGSHPRPGPLALSEVARGPV